MVGLTASAEKVTAAVWVTAIESVVSVAVYVTVSAIVLLTVKAATPEAFVVALAGAIVELPAPWPSETDLPETTLP